MKTKRRNEDDGEESLKGYSDHSFTGHILKSNYVSYGCSSWWADQTFGSSHTKINTSSTAYA